MSGGRPSGERSPSAEPAPRAPHLRERAAATGTPGAEPRVDAGHRVVLRVQGTPIFGPGTYDLLVLAEETGSLHQASKAMGMSYSKAWRIVRQAEERLGLDLLQRRIGGAGGGGSALTEDGRDVVRRFGAFVAEADAELGRLYRKHFGDVSFAQPSGPSESTPT